MWPARNTQLNVWLLWNFRDVTVTLSQNVLFLYRIQANWSDLSIFFISDFKLFGLLEEIGIESSVVFLKCFSIFAFRNMT